jgi:tetratricopeptide (TPR) repeat protein
MNKELDSQTNLKTAILRRHPVVAALALVLLALVIPPRAFAAATIEQQAKQEPNIAKDVGKKDAEKETDKPSDAANKTRNNGKRQPSTPRRGVHPPLEVTFKTDMPESEIFLSRGGAGMQSLGKTDAEGKLTVRLPRGKHQIVASRHGARILRQQIDVQPDSADFNFNLALPAKPEKKEESEVAETVVPEPEPPKPEQTDKAMTDPEEVIRRFLDPKESEGVVVADWEQVRAQTRAGLDKEPGNTQLGAQAHFAEGQLAYLRGDHANALVAFNKAVLANPEYIPAHYALGNAYLITNQPTEAFKAYQRAAALNKELALAYQGMGEALMRQGKMREATEYYNRAKSFGQTLPTDTGLVAARDLKKRKRWGEAVRAFEEIARAKPSADVFTDIGDCYVGLEQPLSASKAYLKATELDPKGALAFYKYGEVMFRLREYASAMESLERALALDTTGVQFNRGKARERANEAAKKIGLKKK